MLLVVVVRAEPFGAATDDRCERPVPRCRARTRSCRHRGAAHPRSRRGSRRDGRPRNGERPWRSGDGPGSTSGATARSHRAADCDSAQTSSAGSGGRLDSDVTNRSGEVMRLGQQVDGLLIAASCPDCSWMRHAVDLPQSFLADLGVDLRRRDRGVPEHLLDDTQVGPVIEQVGRARVPEHVRRQVIGDARPFAVLLDHQPGTLPTQPAAALIEEHRLGVTAPLPTLGSQPSPSRWTEPVVERRCRRRAERYDRAPCRPCRTTEPATRRSRCRRSTPRRSRRSVHRSRTATRAAHDRDAAAGRCRSRRRAGSSICCSVSGFGIPDGTRTPSSRAVGSSGRYCSVAR